MDNELAGELAVALTTVTFFQGAVQHADDKIRTVVAVLGALTAFMSAQLGIFAKPGLNAATAVLLSIFTVTLIAAGVHLFRAFTPFTGVPGSPNRFAFPSVARQANLPQASLRDQHDDAQRLLGMLARLAMAKNRHVRHALTWTGCAYVCAVSSLVAFPLFG